MISDKFTIEDIHRLRYENYMKTKNMTAEEIIEYTNEEAEEGRNIIEELRRKKYARNTETQ